MKNYKQYLSTALIPLLMAASLASCSVAEDIGLMKGKDDDNSMMILGLLGLGGGESPKPGVSASSGGTHTGQITITWSDVTGATSYNLYRGTASGVTTATGTKIESVTSPYTDTGLTNGTDYYYIVTAVSSSASERDASIEVTAYPYLSPLKTYQATCWDASGTVISCSGSGQDGEYQAGRATDFTGPTQHATYITDYTTTDNATGLVWKSCTEGQSGADCQGTGSAGDNYGADSATMTWATATGTGTGCDALNSANSGAGYAGRTDWRVPEVAELKTIINYSTSGPAAFATSFPATVGLNYWSASTYVPSNTIAYYVHFGDGTLYNNFKNITYYVRCVAN